MTHLSYPGYNAPQSAFYGLSAHGKFYSHIQISVFSEKWYIECMAKKQSSERFRKVRKQKSEYSESFGNVPKPSERTANHVLTVRDVAKMFENKGVARTERSIINWCHPNRQGITRLDCYLEPNEGKYYITPISVERVIQEEQNKLKIKGQTNVSVKPGNFSESFGNSNENFGNVRNASEMSSHEGLQKQIKKVEHENRDLQINNKVKDMYIERLEKVQDNFIKELTNKSHRIGELEVTLRQLEAPKERASKKPLIVEPETTIEAGQETEYEQSKDKEIGTLKQDKSEDTDITVEAEQGQIEGTEEQRKILDE